MQINWKMIMHLATTKEHSLLYRADYKGKGVQREIHTPVKEHCKERFGKPKKYFFIDGDKREFKTEEELLKALESEGLK